MKTNFKYLVSFIFIFSAGIVFAQDAPIAAPSAPMESVSNPKHYFILSPRVSVTIPNPMTNQAFKRCFVGVYEISGGLNAYYYKGLFVGANYSNSLLKIYGNKIANYSFHNVGMQLNNVSLKLGGDAFIESSHRVIFSASVAVGKNYTKYTGLRTKDPSKHPALTKYSSSFIEPEINLFFLIEPNFGIGATVSYSMYNKIFDPYELSLTDWTSFTDINAAPTGYLSFGFGFYYSLIQRKKK